MAKSMKIILSPTNEETNTNELLHKGQRVNFINILSGSFPPEVDPKTLEPIAPKTLQYDDADRQAAVILKYSETNTDKNHYSKKQGETFIYSSEDRPIEMFRREVTTKIVNGVEVVDRRLTPLYNAGTNITNFKFSDFNISNDRTYQYVIYPESRDNWISRAEKIIHTHWAAWSITELHPIDGSNNAFEASNDDVWLFNLNVETGEQEQNITRNEVQTLGVYPKYSQGRQNYISGSVSCLLGSEVLPASYALKSGILIGGYQEVRLFDSNPTSNERVDMLKAWRRVVYSGNPKLLKDRKGQSFLITITQNNNKPYDNIGRQPDVISFSWVQIGNASEITVLGK